MRQIKTGKVKMKPRWYFVTGSFLMVIGLIGLAILSIYLTSLISFSLRTHGPMGSIRYQQLLAAFPWWTLPVMLVGMISGIYILKQFDFSYKKNFGLILILLFLSLIAAGWYVDYSGMNQLWMRRNGMRRYQQNGDIQEFHNPKRSPGWRWQR